MGIEQRRNQRHDVRLIVRYTNASEFVTDYVENLSSGGLFIANANHLQLNQRISVAIELPLHGHWDIVAKAVFILDPPAAKRAGRRPGAGMEIVHTPGGFDDALLGYLVRLGRRREHAVIAAEIPGTHVIADAGYRLLPLVSPHEVTCALADASTRVIAVVVSPSLASAYRVAAGDRLFTATTPDEIVETMARIDGLL